MRKALAMTLAILAVAALSFGGVVKSTKSEIVFKGFGSFSATMTGKSMEDRMLSQTDSEFKGKGLLGGLAAKLFLPSGKTGELVDLAAKTITQIDHKRKEYTVTTLEKFAETRSQALSGKEAAPAEKRESDIRIVKSEFKVDATDESKTINGFACRKFQARWTVDWENVRTNEKGTDRLETAVWTTPMTDALKGAQAEEMAYSKAYLTALGLDADKFQRDVLGMEWLGLLAMFDPASGDKSKLAPDAALVSREMKKIEGYPIVIDGKYFPAPKPKAAESEDSGGGGIGGALGKLGKGLLKKKPNPEEEKAPAVAFKSEVTALTAGSVDISEFQVPAGYKKK